MQRELVDKYYDAFSPPRVNERRINGRVQFTAGVNPKAEFLRSYSGLHKTCNLTTWQAVVLLFWLLTIAMGLMVHLLN